MISETLGDFGGWRNAHSAAFAAWCVTSLPHSDPRKDLAALWLDERFAASVSALSGVQLDSENIDSSLGGVPSLWGLPEYPLRMLARLSTCSEALPESIGKLPVIAASLWEARTKQRRLAGRPIPSRARSTRTIASMLVDGLTNAEGVLAFASRQLHPDWKAVARSEGCVAAVRNALPTLRRTPGNVEAKLRALLDIRAAIGIVARTEIDGDRGLGWSRVEIDIVNRLFAWPLVAATTRGESGSIGLSIPMHLDVTVDGSTLQEPVGICGADGRLRADWHGSLILARDAAIDLWLKETGHFGVSWRERVRDGIKVTFDLSAAETIVDLVAEAEWGEDKFEFDLEGRSLELASALALFSNLRGLRAPFAAGSTGLIDKAEFDNSERDAEPENEPNSTGLDRTLLAPKGIIEKLRWVDAAGIFDKLILPRLDGIGGRDSSQNAIPAGGEVLHAYLSQERARGVHAAQLNYCEKLSVAADSAFSGKWRRFQFVRCPELSLLLEADRAASFRAKAEEVLPFLCSTRDAVAIAPLGLGLTDICGALAWMNVYGRSQMPWDDGIPPMLSAAIVRLVADETPGRLCALLCDIVGAPWEVLSGVTSAGSDAERARKLAVAINKRQQEARYPGWRGQDLMIFSVPERVLREIRNGATIDAAKDDGLRRWLELLSPFFEQEFTANLQRSVDSRWGETLGRARIILAAEETALRLGRDARPGSSVGKTVDGEPDKAKQDERDSLQILELLTVFRNGFTQQEASALLRELGLTGIAVRRSLRSLEERELAYYANGSWCLSTKGRELAASQKEPNREQVVERHCAAAIARAPYLAIERLSGLADFESRSLDKVHEAQYHVDQALRERVADDLRSTLHAWKVFLWLYFDAPGWDTVFEAATNRIFTQEISWARFVIEAGERLLAEAHINGKGAGLERVGAVVRVIEQRKRRIESAYPTVTAAQQDEEWRGLTEKTFEILESFAGIARELPGMGLPVLSAKPNDRGLISGAISLVALLLVRPSRLTRQEKSELEEWLSRALPLVASDELDLPPTWFEQQGDAQQDRRNALKWYQRGYLAEASYIGNWVKALGCLAEEEEEDIETIIQVMSKYAKGNPEQWRRMRTFARRTRLGSLERNTRWNRGLQYLIDRDSL